MNHRNQLQAGAESVQLSEMGLTQELRPQLDIEGMKDDDRNRCDFPRDFEFRDRAGEAEEPQQQHRQMSVADNRAPLRMNCPAAETSRRQVSMVSGMRGTSSTAAIRV